jgi:hypothetical protein
MRLCLSRVLRPMNVGTGLLHTRSVRSKTRAYGRQKDRAPNARFYQNRQEWRWPSATHCRPVVR